MKLMLKVLAAGLVGFGLNAMQPTQSGFADSYKIGALPAITQIDSAYRRGIEQAGGEEAVLVIVGDNVKGRTMHPRRGTEWAFLDGRTFPDFYLRGKLYNLVTPIAIGLPNAKTKYINITVVVAGKAHVFTTDDIMKFDPKNETGQWRLMIDEQGNVSFAMPVVESKTYQKPTAQQAPELPVSKARTFEY